MAVKPLPQIIAERDMRIQQTITEIDLNIIQEMHGHVSRAEEKIKSVGNIIAGIKSGSLDPKDVVGNEDGWDVKPKLGTVTSPAKNSRQEAKVG